MNDTQLFGKRVVLTGVMKAGLIYVGLDVCLSSLLSFGQTLYDLKQEDWVLWWTPKKVAWIMMQLGGIASSALLTLKAFFSNSNKPTPPTV